MSFATLEELIVSAADSVRPPERLTVSEAAAKYRQLYNPGSYVGPWKNEKTPYMVEPMDTLTSLDYTGMAFVGPARTGKALALDTPMPTPTGWTTMGELREGDLVFGSAGKPTKIIAKSEVFLDHDCYLLVFDDGRSMVADAGHKWKVRPHNSWVWAVYTTEELATRPDLSRMTVPRTAGANIGGIYRAFGGQTIVFIQKVASVPTQCICVDAPDHLFVAGRGCVLTHNSDIFFNWLLYTAVCDPADVMQVNMTQATARDWSQGDLARVIRHNPELAERMVQGRQNDNVHDKWFKSGMRLLIKWPTITELSGKTIPRLWLNDYDRMKDNVDKEGNPFDVTRKRAQTYKRFGMCVAESSPGRDVKDPKWTPRTPHEAPPSGGILSIYNRGDRRRWYWQCIHCREAFEPAFKLFQWPDSKDLMEASEQTTIMCPHCGSLIGPEHKNEMNQSGKWIKDGMVWMPDGSVLGTPYRSDIASFWMKGPAAAFQDWSKIVFNYLTAKEEYDRTAKEESLKTTTNVDQGEPYSPVSVGNERLPESLADRAEDWGGSAENPVVPEGVRFLVATVDVQGGGRPSFVVHVHGFGEGGDIWLVDMFKIRKSERLDADGERHLLDPSSYDEDWRLLLDRVINATYPLGDESGRRMQIKMVGCDSGGAAGVTTRAYNFWRWLRDNHSGEHLRFRLVKGEPSRFAPRFRVSYPDVSGKKDRHSGARGEIPVTMLNATILKDQVAGLLGRVKPGGGMVHFPIWAEDWLYKQLTAETRGPDRWMNPGDKRNEAFDLLYYAVGICQHPEIRLENIDWKKPPVWAAEWDKNNMIVSVDEKGEVVPVAKPTKKRRGLADLGKSMG